jgi:hypothetical protein
MICAGMVVSTLLGVFFLFGVRSTASSQSERRVIEADEFVVRDATGKVRARLMSDKENVALWFYDTQGTPRLVSGVYAVEPIFYADTPEERKELMKESLEKGKQCVDTQYMIEK